MHLHTDDFWHYVSSGGMAPYLPEADTQNHTVVKVIAGAACTYAEGGCTVVVDGVVGPWRPANSCRGGVIGPPTAGGTPAATCSQ